MATPFSIVRLDALPSTLAANTMYVIRESGGTRVRLTFTGNDPSKVASTIGVNDVNSIITTALESFTSIYVFATYADMLTARPTANVLGFVKDARGDVNVSTPTATYVYEASANKWHLSSAAQGGGSQTVNWSEIIGRPSASVASIDLAASQTHTHTNMSVLNLMGVNAAGKLTYNGVQVSDINFSSNW